MDPDRLIFSIRSLGDHERTSLGWKDWIFINLRSVNHNARVLKQSAWLLHPAVKDDCFICFAILVCLWYSISIGSDIQWR